LICKINAWKDVVVSLIVHAKSLHPFVVYTFFGTVNDGCWPLKPFAYFVDPSLAIAALGVTPERLLNDLNTYGFMFEAMCIRDLRIYAESFGAQIFHYRDDASREIDAVIELPDGRWGAFKIKLGMDQIDKAAKDLHVIKALTKADPKAKAPDILCVICGLADFAYTREDGVMVVPITALKP
jgi:hypothetical protein